MRVPTLRLFNKSDAHIGSRTELFAAAQRARVVSRAWRGGVEVRSFVSRPPRPYSLTAHVGGVTHGADSHRICWVRWAERPSNPHCY